MVFYFTIQNKTINKTNFFINWVQLLLHNKIGMRLSETVKINEFLKIQEWYYNIALLQRHQKCYFLKLVSFYYTLSLCHHTLHRLNTGKWIEFRNVLKLQEVCLDYATKINIKKVFYKIWQARILSN